MAFTATTVWEVETGGDDTNNGGGFDTGVAGFPTDGAATLATGTAPVFTSASYNFVAGDVGAWIYIKSGTNWTAGWYNITSVAANAATLNAVIGSAVLAAGTPTTVAGCATTASPTAATWGIDYSQQASAQISFTDLVIDGTTNTKFTSVAHPVGKNFIGNTISVTSGTGFTVQRVVVISTAGAVATCDKSLGTLSSAGGNGGLGGAILSPSIAGSVAVGGNTIYVKSGTYTISTNTAAIANGSITLSATILCVGYSTNRYLGNTDAPPVFQTSGSTITQLNAGSFYNITFDGNSQTASRLLSANLGPIINCTIKNFNTTMGGSILGMLACLYTGNSVGALYAGAAYCEAYGNTSTPFTGTQAFRCLSYSNTGVSTDGFGPPTGSVTVECISVSNGRAGFRGGASNTVINCHAQSNTTFGYDAGANGQLKVFNSTGYLNTSGLINSPAIIIFYFNVTSVSGDVFVNAAGNNYALNNLTGAGAALRAAGRMAVLNTFPRGLTSDYRDIGAAQHQDSPSVSVHTQQVNIISQGSMIGY